MPRAYSPRMTTTHLVACILALPGVATVRTLPPTTSRGTRLRITLESGVHSDFTLPDARAWLAAESRVWTVAR